MGVHLHILRFKNREIAQMRLGYQARGTDGMAGQMLLTRRLRIIHQNEWFLRQLVTHLS
jgi:hypothetical protein